MDMNIKRKIRMGPALVSRNGRRYPLGMYVGLCVLISAFYFTMTFLSGKVERTTTVASLRLGELPTWPQNHTLSLQDYIDVTNINTFIRQPNDAVSSKSTLPVFCGGNSIRATIFVTSAANHSLQRQTIRETWGSPEELERKLVKLYFVIGRSVNDTDEDDVALEADQHGDILQEDFLDTYHNLTLKTAAILKWVNLTCSTGNLNATTMPPYILKTDDDMFINIDRLFDVIHKMPDAQMIGRLICGADAVADTKSKWFMPHYLFPGKQYPGYLSGTGYALAGSAVPPLLQAALTTPIIHMEDIYFTGTVAKKASIYPEDSPAFTYLKVDSKEMCVLKEMVSSHMIEPKEMRKIWSQWNNFTLTSCASVLTPKLRQKLIRRAVPRVKNMSKRLKKLCQFI